MKRFFIVLLLVFLVISGQVYAQMAVFDAGVSALLTGSHIEQVIYYADSLAQFIQQVTLLAQQVEYSYEMAQRAVQNLQSANINSWDDFTNWYNRQLYLEHRTMETIENWNLSIGGKPYSFWDIENMAQGFNETYIEYWNNEFTEKQRKDMWLNLGLTPSNYVYRQTFKGKLVDLQRQFIAATEIQNEENNMRVTRLNEIWAHLANDQSLDSDEKMGEKEVLMYIAELTIDNNKLLSESLMYEAQKMEMEATKLYLENTHVDAPALSYWPEAGFSKLKNLPVR